MDTTLTRRSFVKWGTATVGATALVGFTGCAPGGGKAEDASEGTQQKAGEWLNAPCYNNCSCGSSRCLNRVYVEDGVPLKNSHRRGIGRHVRHAAAPFLLAWSCKNQ